MKQPDVYGLCEICNTAKGGVGHEECAKLRKQLHSRDKKHSPAAKTVTKKDDLKYLSNIGR